jgi:hypothetical protein
MERNIDRNGSSKPRAARNVRTFGDLIDLHDLRRYDKPGTGECSASQSSINRAMLRSFSNMVGSN